MVRTRVNGMVGFSCKGLYLWNYERELVRTFSMEITIEYRAAFDVA